MQKRSDFTRSSIYSILNHLNILNERNLMKILRHHDTHVVCEIIRYLASYDVCTLKTPQEMIDFILSHHHLNPYLEAIKTLIYYRLLSKEFVLLISQNDQAYLLTEVIILLKKYNLYSSENISLIIQHPQKTELVNLWTLLDMVNHFNLDLFRLTTQYPQPQILIDCLCIFKKMNILNMHILNCFFYCLQKNTERQPSFIANKLVERHQQKLQQSFKPHLAVIEEETSEDILSPKH